MRRTRKHGTQGRRLAQGSLLPPGPVDVRTTYGRQLRVHPVSTTFAAARHHCHVHQPFRKVVKPGSKMPGNMVPVRRRSPWPRHRDRRAPHGQHISHPAVTPAPSSANADEHAPQPTETATSRTPSPLSERLSSLCPVIVLNHERKPGMRVSVIFPIRALTGDRPSPHKFTSQTPEGAPRQLPSSDRCDAEDTFGSPGDMTATHTDHLTWTVEVSCYLMISTTIGGLGGTLCFRNGAWTTMRTPSTVWY